MFPPSPVSAIHALLTCLCEREEHGNILQKYGNQTENAGTFDLAWEIEAYQRQANYEQLGALNLFALDRSPGNLRLLTFAWDLSHRNFARAF